MQFETMVPSEILAEREKNGIVYLPIGCMEWHGPHMGMGMDTINAYQVSLLSCEQTGGVVFPPFYIGTETPRSPQTLKTIGFSGSESIVGMDFPKNSIKSFYWPPELFEMMIRCQAEMLKRMGYRRIIFANGHCAEKQIEILNRVAEELSDDQVKVVNIAVLFESCGYGIGHAGLVETAIMQVLCPEGVDLSELPDRTVRLKNTDFAIVDHETFVNGPNEDFSVRFDPRDATPETGEEIVKFAVKKVVEIVLNLC